MICRQLFLLFLCLYGTAPGFALAQSIDFDGKEYWDRNFINFCNNESMDTTWKYKESACFYNGQFYEFLKVEILFWRPALVIFRDLLSERQVKRYSSLLNRLEMERSEVISNEGEPTVSNVRVAEGKDTENNKFEEARDIVDSLKTLLPMFNLSNTENLSALKYKTGGHYATHYDYLIEQGSQGANIPLMGNRLATLILVFGKAERGGATIFPRLGAAVRANVGDGYLWFNQKGDGSQEDLVEHGGCPILSGEKVISTLWIRSQYQDILKNAGPRSLSVESIFPKFFYPWE